MQTKRNKLATAVFAGFLLTNMASAHPGHAPTDLAAQLTFPFAGADHFIVFAALTSVLLVGLRLVLMFRNAKGSTRINEQC
jgi:hypothetical protein